MSKFFDEYKQEIINNQKEVAYKPSSEKFDKLKLLNVYKNVPKDLIESEDDFIFFNDFVYISDYLHKLYINFYNLLDENFSYLNLIGNDISEYIIAAMNREYKVVENKRLENIRNHPKGTYQLTDVMNYKIEAADDSGQYLDIRGALENFIDSASLILNYLRYKSGTKFDSSEATPDEFASHIIGMLNKTSMLSAFKQTYDDILYNDGFVRIISEKKKIIFDYDDHERLKLEKAGDLVFTQCRVQVFNKMIHDKIVPRISKYKTNYRLKKPSVNNGCITLQFGRGIPKEFDSFLMDMQSAMDSFYEFLDGDLILTKLAGATFDEAVTVWTACQYICHYILQNINFDVPLYTKEDFAAVPYKINKTDLIDYVVKLINVKPRKVMSILDALTATTKNFNDIWSAPIYSAGKYYLLPFYPLIMSAPYHVFDQMLKKGGCDLDERGKWFEKYLYNQLTEKKTSYPITCIPPGIFEFNQHNKEEIDLIVSLRDIVIIVEAKCIHYSMERTNYYDAWKRLKGGCEQAKRKVDFVKNHPILFSQLGDYSAKPIIPVVITNYPIFTGLSHSNVYVTDAYSFLSYMHTGIMSTKVLHSDIDYPIGFKLFYRNENEFSANFLGFLQNNPLKNIMMEDIYIGENHVLKNIGEWTCIAKSAMIDNDPTFNIPKSIRHKGI